MSHQDVPTDPLDRFHWKVEHHLPQSSSVETQYRGYLVIPNNGSGPYIRCASTLPAVLDQLRSIIEGMRSQ